ncbi:hypothetical protein SESBI_33942 [Sesbania bispinosa]|nr:hypothetical protein SESBI_33942 [Sesbania bispinosa]
MWSIVSHNSVKATKVSGKGVDDLNKEESTVEVPVSNEMNDGLSVENNEGEDDEVDVDSSSE